MMKPSFSQNYTSTSQRHSDIKPELSTPTQRWLLANLCNLFGSTLQIECRHKKYGSVVYRSGCDLLKAVSPALGKLSQNKKQGLVNDDNRSIVIHKVGQYINKKLHKQSKHLVRKYQQPSSLVNFSLEEYKQEVDIDFFDFVSTLTSTTRIQQTTTTKALK